MLPSWSKVRNTVISRRMPCGHLNQDDGKITRRASSLMRPPVKMAASHMVLQGEPIWHILSSQPRVEFQLLTSYSTANEDYLYIHFKSHSMNFQILSYRKLVSTKALKELSKTKGKGGVPRAEHLPLVSSMGNSSVLRRSQQQSVFWVVLLFSPSPCHRAR